MQGRLSSPPRWRAVPPGIRLAGPSPPARLQLPPLNASTDRITRITVCTRPFRAEGPRLYVELSELKPSSTIMATVGAGWSLSWGSRGHRRPEGPRRRVSEASPSSAPVR